MPLSAIVSAPERDRFTLWQRSPSDRPWSRETQLLLLFARSHLDSSAKTRITDLVNRPLDWSDFWEQVSIHKVSVLVLKNLRSLDLDGIPNDILDKLGSRCRQIGVDNLLLVRELRRLLDLFSIAHIPVIPYKGPVLAQQIYAQTALRNSSDLDLLVQPQHVEQARQVLIAHGYDRQWSLNAQQEEQLIQTFYTCEFTYPPCPRIYLELHWDICHQYSTFRRNLNPFWQRSQTINFQGKQTQTFTPEDWLLILCIHGSKDNWKRLKWLCDLEALLSTYPDLDWRVVISRAQELGWEQPLIIGLALISRLLDVVIPSSVDCLISNLHTHQKTITFLESHLFTEPEKRRALEDFPHWNSNRFYRWRYLLNKLVPREPDYALIELPQALFFLYYVIRPLRLLIEYGLKENRMRRILTSLLKQKA
ncbi:MAG: nucleotidyltransferase family protein [Cyanobacteria bacterium P01_H01_bin.15]